MARSIRRRNPRIARNSKGRFVKVKSNPRKHRKHRSHRKASVRKLRRRVRHVVKHVVNPRKRRHRRLRHNPLKNPSAVSKRASKRLSKKARVSHKRKRHQKRRSKSLAMVRKLYKRARKAPRRSVRRSVAMAQYHRASALRRLARKRGAVAVSRSPLAKAMHIKSNPGVDGLMASAKVLAPQVAVGGVALFGVAMGGKMLADKVREMAGASIPASVSPYVPAISSVVLSGVGYVVADKVAPKYKGAVVIGGLLGAVVQAVVAAAASSADENSILAKAKRALLGDYTLVGDYTTVGGRAYAEAGIFREIGDYTTVGQGMDNATEFAHDSLRGLDDTTEFAPGEGGVLSGGLFRGPSSR